MIESYLGEDAFKAGIQRYIQEYQYRNANRHDLFESLRTYGKEDLNTVFENWLVQPGYPVLFIDIGTDNEVILQQESIQQVKNPNIVINPPLLWQIPICYSTDAVQNQYILMTEDEETHDLPH